MDDVGPSNRGGEILIGAFAKIDRFAMQHLFQARLLRKMFCLFENDANFEIWLPPNCRGDGHDEGFNAAIRTQAWTNEQELDRSHDAGISISNARAIALAICGQAEVRSCHSRNLAARDCNSAFVIPFINSLGEISRERGSDFAASA